MTDRLTGAFIGRLFNCVCFGADEGVEVCVCVYSRVCVYEHTQHQYDFIRATTRSQNNKIKANNDNGRCVCVC